MASTQQVDNLVNMLDGYMAEGGYHLNVNRCSEASGELPTVNNSCIWIRS